MNWTIQQVAIFGWFLAAAVSDVATAVVVRARAGTGKTTTIVEAIKRFLMAAREASRRVKVLACAFNKEIADELTSRFPGLPEVDAKTLHALGNWYVMQALGNRRPRQIDSGKGRAWYLANMAEPYAPNEALDLITELNQKGREIEPFAKTGKDLESLAFQFEILPDEDLVRMGWTTERICDAAAKAMACGAKDFKSMDFADMIFWPLVNNWVFPKYDLTVVDEAQDMTRAQLELALRATYEQGHVAVVGDDRQAIYAFRGADSGSLDRLKAELKAEEMGLTVTYRCGKAIVALAQKLVPDYQVADDAHEGMVCDSSVDRMLANAQAGDFILSRTNAPLAPMCLSLLRDGKRAYIRGKEIGKGLIVLIRKQNQKHVDDLLPALAKWAEREIASITKRGGDDDKVSAKCDLIRDKVAVIEALSDGCTATTELIGRIESMFETPKKGTPETRVMLSTVHKSKGLEAPSVYLLEKTFKRRGGEEDNIRYVAITRAKNGLHLVQDSVVDPAQG